MLSHARTEVGAGRAFGINESLDALGATIGPLVMAAMLAWRGSYRAGFATLLASALLCLALLAVTHRRYPSPEAFEDDAGPSSTHLPRSYWLNVAAAGLIAFGFVDFSLIAFHLQRTGTLSPDVIPISYAVAMGAGAVGNWVLGSLYDRLGLPLLIGAFLVGACFTPLVFFGPPVVAFAGMALWGLNKGAQDTLFKPTITPLIAAGRRSTAFGIFDTGFGIAWLAGSIAFGLLYGRSLPLLVTISVATQLLSLPLFLFGRRASQKSI
jgi:predicted MFS family arabinose efflux permease